MAGVSDSAKLAAPYVEPPSDTVPNKLPAPPRLTNTQGLNVFRWAYRYADGAALTDTSHRLLRMGLAEATAQTRPSKRPANQPSPCRQPAPDPGVRRLGTYPNGGW